MNYNIHIHVCIKSAMKKIFSRVIYRCILLHNLKEKKMRLYSDSRLQNTRAGIILSLLIYIINIILDT